MCAFPRFDLGELTVAVGVEIATGVSRFGASRHVEMNEHGDPGGVDMEVQQLGMRLLMSRRRRNRLTMTCSRRRSDADLMCDSEPGSSM